MVTNMPGTRVIPRQSAERAFDPVFFLSSKDHLAYQSLVIGPNASTPANQSVTVSISSTPNKMVIPSVSYEMVTVIASPTAIGWTAKPIIQESTDWGKLFGKLDDLLRLQRGWDGYKAAPPNALARERTRSFLESLCLEGYVPSQVAASVIGGIGVSRWRGKNKVYIEFNNNGKVHALFSDGVSAPRVEPIQPDKIGFNVLIRRMRAYLDE
jgi:hypothetical protein